MDPRLVVALLMFVGASLSDLRTRRVPNQYWWPFVAAAGVFLAADLAGGRFTFAHAAWAAGTTAAVYGLWRAHLYGGADAKALMLLAWLWPAVPDLGWRVTPAIDTLVAATAAMVLLPVAFLGFNALRTDVTLPAALLGFRMDAARAERMHVWPMQEATADGMRWRYMQRLGVDTGPILRDLARAGHQRVWVTPKIPFMLPLTLGVVAQALWGDVLLRLMAHIIG